MEHELLRIPWVIGDWPVGYLHHAVKELNSGFLRTNHKPGSGKMKDLNQGSPDFKSSILNFSATLLPPRSYDTEVHMLVHTSANLPANKV